MITLFHFAAPVNVENFGLGIFDNPIPVEPAPCPFALADSAVKAGTASYRPQTNGRGLSAREHLTMLASRNEAFRLAERTAKGDDLQRAEAVGNACELATERTLRAILAAAPARKGRFVPTADDAAYAAQLFAEVEMDRLHEAMEAACQEAEWADRASGIAILEDEMALIGACG
jgi:hypothetical protein